MVPIQRFEDLAESAAYLAEVELPDLIDRGLDPDDQVEVLCHLIVVMDAISAMILSLRQHLRDPQPVL